MVSIVLLSKASNYTDKGEIIRNNIIRYKSKIEDKEFLVEKKQMNEILQKQVKYCIFLSLQYQNI